MFTKLAAGHSDFLASQGDAVLLGGRGSRAAISATVVYPALLTAVERLQ